MARTVWKTTTVKHKRLHFLTSVWILVSFYSSQVIMLCEARLELRLEVWRVGISGLNGGCVKVESEEMTLIFSGHSNVWTHTHTQPPRGHTYISAGGVKAFSRHRRDPRHPSTQGCGSMMRNIISCVMKTLNPQLLFQGGHFSDERWCYDSEGLQSKTLLAPPVGH